MINSVLIDPDSRSLGELRILLQHFDDLTVIDTYTDPIEAIAHIVLTKPDVVFMESHYQTCNGIDFAMQMKKIIPLIQIVFISAFKEYAVRAFEIETLDYLLKPVSPQRIADTIKRILKNKSLCEFSETSANSYEIRLFGPFRIMRNESQAMKWRTSKTKELLAYLLCNRTKLISKYDIVMELFNDDSLRAYNNLYITKYYLQKSMLEFGISSELFAINPDYSIHIAPGICDFIDFCTLPDTLQANQTNIENIQRLLKLYAAPLLNNETYEWVAFFREYMNKKYETVALTTANYHLSHKEYDKAICILTRLLDICPCSEEGYSLLLDIYKETENDMQYIKIYREYEQLLMKNYHVVPDTRYLNYQTHIVQSPAFL